MGFVPANPQDGEEYGHDLEEAYSLLRGRLSNDIVSCRMLHHLMGKVYAQEGRLMHEIRNFERAK